MGLTAGNNATGARCFLAGKSAGLGSTAADLIVVGDSALKTANTSNPGTIAIGTNAAGALNSLGSNSGATAGMVVIGDHAMDVNPAASASVVIGSNCLRGFNSTAAAPIGLVQSVAVGADIFANVNSQRQMFNCTLVGYGIAQGSAFVSQFVNNTLIGAQIAQTLGALGGSCSGQTIIGFQAGKLLGQSLASSSNVAVGATALSGADGGSSNVVLGTSAGQNIVGGSFNVLIGTSAGNLVGGDPTNFLEISNGGNALLRGRFDLGNVALGGSSSANMDVALAGATNIVKVINGTKSATAPTAGGYFYVSAGALHWVGSTGTDTVVAPA